MTRDPAIDVLRGLAIFTMVAANAAPYALRAPHPFAFRCWGSFAAPLFITIAGVLVARTARDHPRPGPYFIARGGMTVVVGILIDLLVWKIWPLLTVDILYLIGAALPLTYLVSRLRRPMQVLLTLSVFLLAPWLRSRFGYAAAPYEFQLSAAESWRDFSTAAIARQWWLDGWFPLFPWLGFAWLGCCLAPLRERRRILWPALAASVLGLALFYWKPGPLYVREDYSELFYPPSFAYTVLAVGVVGVLWAASDRFAARRVLRPLAWLGRCSLAMYALHLVLIEFLLVPWLPKQGLAGFSLVYLGLTLTLVAAAYGIGRLKQAWPRRPWLVQFLLGG